MMQYYCKNGETVYVSDDPQNSEQLNVRYHGKNYKRPKDSIGRTLFREDPTCTYIGSRLTLVNLVSGEISLVEIIPDHKKIEYRTMGKMKYKPKTEEVSDSRAGEKNGETILITDVSPIGRAVLGKRQGDVVNVTIEANNIAYQIKSINNSFMFR